MVALTHPFDPVADLLADALVVNDFLASGMAGFESLARHFDLAEDGEAAMQLGIALQSYVRGDLQQAMPAFQAFTGGGEHLALLGRVMEVLYKAISFDLPQASENCLSIIAAVYQAYPEHLEAQRMLIEFFVYFGLWTHALSLHAQLSPTVFEPWRRYIMLSRARAEGFRPRRRFSFVVLTWNRADLLERCLTEIRAKAASDDFEILVGVNACTDHTALILDKQPVDKVLWNAGNDSIDYYRALFDAAQGNILIEIDDNVVELPEAFDLVLERHLQTFPEFGYLGFQPTRLDADSGARAPMEGAPESAYTPVVRAGLMVYHGPVWGCCAAISKRDWLDIGGFYGAKMSKSMGEESQILRKLNMHGRAGGLIRSGTLLKCY